MDSFLFAVNSVLPIILMVAAGYLLKRLGMIGGDLIKAANRLIFRFFLPITLFLNVYRIDGLGAISLGFVLYTSVAAILMFLLWIPAVRAVTREAGSRGALLQATFRSNFALIGIPLATSIFGAAGAAEASVLSAFTIPLFNVLAVISLLMFQSNSGGRSRLRTTLLGIAKNPLILSVLAGLLVLALRALCVELDIGFRLSDLKPVYSAAETLSAVSTPLALIVLGAQFEFSAVREKRREILVGTLARTVISPLLCLGVAAILFGDRFSGAQFAAMSAAFLTPVAVASVPMAQEMKADTVLAGQLVVWTTAISAITSFLGIFILSAVGIFPA